MKKKKLKIKKYPNGGSTNPPIFTNNPKDPRIQAYKDSLDLYNWGEKTIDIVKNTKKYLSSEETVPSNIHDIFNRLTKLNKKEPQPSIFDAIVKKFTNPEGSTSIDRAGHWTNPTQPVLPLPNTAILRKTMPDGTKYYAENKNSKYADIIIKPEIKQKPKEQPINIQSYKGELSDILMPGNTYDDNGRQSLVLDTHFRNGRKGIDRMTGETMKDLPIETIPFKKGTYFTRKPQQQEQGKTQYFDKNGKKLGEFAEGGMLSPKINQNPEEIVGFYPQVDKSGWPKFINPRFADSDIKRDLLANDASLYQEQADKVFQQVPFWMGRSKEHKDDYQASEQADWNALTPDQQSQIIDKHNNELDMKKNGGIHINPKNKGKFNALKKKTDKSTEELTHSKNPLTRKRAIFAQNAKKWHHENGGYAENGLQLNPDYNQQDYWNQNGQFQAPYINNVQMPDYQYNQNFNITPPAPELTDNSQFQQRQPSNFRQQGIANTQGNRSFSNTLMTGLQNAPAAIEAASKGDYSKLASADVSPFVIAGTVMDAIGTQRTNKRLRKQQADEFKDAQTQQYLNHYTDDMYGNGNPMQYADGGINSYRTAEFGANLEAEKGEIGQLPNGLIDQIDGNKHYNGGTMLNLPPGSKILSEKLKEPISKKSYAKLGKKLETKKDIENLKSPLSDDINKFTANLNIEKKNEKLDLLFNLQENNKLDGTHGDKVRRGTMDEYMNQEPEPLQEDTYSPLDQLNTVGESNGQYNFKKNGGFMKFKRGGVTKIDNPKDYIKNDHGIYFNYNEVNIPEGTTLVDNEGFVGDKGEILTYKRGKWYNQDGEVITETKQGQSKNVDENMKELYVFHNDQSVPLLPNSLNPRIIPNEDGNFEDLPASTNVGRQKVLTMYPFKPNGIGYPQIQQAIDNQSNINSIQPSTQNNINNRNSIKSVKANYPNINYPQTTPTGFKYQKPQDVPWLNWQNNIDQSVNSRGFQVPIADNTGNHYGTNDSQSLVNSSYQEQSYDDALDTPEGRKALARMIDETGLTAKGVKLGIKLPSGKLSELNDKDLTNALNKYRPAYIDSQLDYRKANYITPKEIAFKQKEVKNSDIPVSNTNFNLNSSKSTDYLSGIHGVPTPYIDDFYQESAIPRFKFNPNLINYRNQTPDFTEIDRQYQGARTGDPRVDANLFKQSLLAKNQQLFQTNSQNQQGNLQVDQYNAGALDRNQQLQYGENSTYRGLVSQMKGNIGTQKLIDQKDAASDFSKKMGYYNEELPFLQKAFNPSNTNNVNAYTGINPYISIDPNDNATTEILYDKNGNPVSKRVKEKKKYGGKISLKMKKSFK